MKNISKDMGLSNARLPTPTGEFEITVWPDEAGKEHLTLIKGDVRGRRDVLVRVHSECLTGDVFGSTRCDCGSQLRSSMKQIAAAEAGVLVYLRQEGRGIGLAAKLQSYRLQDEGLDTVEANVHLGFAPDLRTYDFAAHILKELGVQSIRLLTNNPEKIDALNKAGVVISDRVHLSPEITAENFRYLSAKVKKMGHLIGI